MLVGHFPRQLEWQKFAPMHNHTENGCNWSGPLNGPQYTSCPRNYYPLFSAVRSRAHYWLDTKYHSSVITAVWQRHCKRTLQETVQLCTCYIVYGSLWPITKALADGPVGQVLAGPPFLKTKNKVPFYRKQVINKSAKVIFGPVQLVIFMMRCIEKHIMQWKIIGHPRMQEYSMQHKDFYCAKNLVKNRVLK